jgi:type IV pilus assembly protein PilV
MSRRSSQSGVALVEVLVVFFILGVGLLGIAALQTKSIQYNQSAYIRSQANVAAYAILDSMRVNSANLSSYAIALGGSATGGTVAGDDLVAWKSFLSTTLPSGDGSVSCDGSNVCIVTVIWMDRVAGVMTQANTNYPPLTVVSQIK